MMLNRFSKTLAGAGLVLAMAACTSKKDGNIDNPPTTVAEDKAAITATSKELVQGVKNLSDGQMVRSLFKTIGLENGQIKNEVWMDDLTDALDMAFLGFELDPETSRFDFSRYSGEYTWNAQTKKFVKTAASDITVKFPADPASATNDYVFKISEYKDGKYKVNMKDVYLPTAIKANLKKGADELLTLTFNAEFSTGNFPIPSNIQLLLKLKPVDFAVKVTKLSDTQFDVATRLLAVGDNATALNAKVTFKDNDYNNLDIEEDLIAVEGALKQGNLTLKGALDAKSYFLLPDGASADKFNTVFNLSAFSKDQEIGQLKLKDNNNGQEMVIFYKDKTSEKASVYTEAFIKDLKAVLQPDFGTDVENWFERTAQSKGSFAKKIVNIKNKVSGWIGKK
ncbi:hypothetical protein [Chitinophaga solisilvae]|uniref:Uncharacterized protein n=1 Tax=Chitinophaga solisilvae TaxID=1233460 RepID=A0A3S1DSY2_9BACT|nr:hypothetical protein [Chitinophaga solisilvae]NSL89270.1 hypothetical protein [Chitinophaga solisilvae]